MILSGFYNYFMGSYDVEREYVMTKRAQFLFWFFIIYGAMMSLVPLVFAITAGHDRAIQGLIAAYPQLPLLIIALILVRKRKIRTAANIMGWIAFLLSIAGYLTRPVPLSGVSMAYFQFAAVVFSIFFCSYSLAVFFYAAIIIADTAYFALLIRPTIATLDPLLQTAAYSQLFDIPIALTIVFICGLSATKIVNKALQIMQQQTAENMKQAQANENLVSTIRDVAGKLTTSIERTSSVITSFSDNARTQAASVEELSATIDEISAGTESAQQATIDQNSSVHELIASIEKLSSSIDLMEQYGSQISEVFSGFLHMAREGETSSRKLDETNRQITHSSNEILSVITIIEEFFDKIKMLSLNATIEAARAGEYGRGFAVVASEIGKLSEDSAKELTQINELIQRNNSDVESGNVVITEILRFIQSMLKSAAEVQEKTQSILGEIVQQKQLKNEMNEKTGVVKQNADMIEVSMGEQKRAIDDVVRSISDTNDIVQTNASNTEVMQQNAEELQKLAEELNREFS